MNKEKCVQIQHRPRSQTHRYREETAPASRLFGGNELIQGTTSASHQKSRTVGMSFHTRAQKVGKQVAGGGWGVNLLSDTHRNHSRNHARRKRIRVANYPVHVYPSSRDGHVHHGASWRRCNATVWRATMQVQLGDDEQKTMNKEKMRAKSTSTTLTNTPLQRGDGAGPATFWWE